MNKYYAFVVVLVSVFILAIFITTEVFGIRELLPAARDPYVNDYINIINAQDEQVLKKVLEDIHQKQSIHINIVTITSPQSYILRGGGNIESFAYHLYKNWKSTESNHDLDVLILISAVSREVRIEFGGSMDGKYNTKMEQVIIESMTPAFKQHRYSDGIFQGVRDIVKTLTGAVIVADPVMADRLDICNIWGQILGIGKVTPESAFGILWWSLVVWIISTNFRNRGGFYQGGGIDGTGGEGSSGGDGSGDGSGGGSGDGGSGGW